jgi:uncharacterized membrane protein
LHPLLTHLPIGVWASAAAWDTAALWTGEPAWWRMSFWALVLGLAAFVPTAVAGFLDSLSIPGDTPAERTATWHLAAVSSAAAAYLGSALVRGGPDPPGAAVAAVALAAAGLLLLAAGGWLGAELVYRHRVGVRDAGGRDR